METKDLHEIQSFLKGLLQEYKNVLKETANTSDKYEVSGTVEAMQGRKKVEGIYFASIVPKPKDIRFYFFPCYTHKDQLGELPENLQKALKGKSCFHIKKMTDDFRNNMKMLVEKSVELYQKDGLLAK